MSAVLPLLSCLLGPTPAATPSAAALAEPEPAPVAAPAVSGGPTSASAAAPPADRYALAQALAQQVSSGTPAAVEAVRRRLARGVPPEATAAVLGAMRAIPSRVHVPLLEDLATHRAPEVRAHAFAILAMVAPERAAALLSAARADARPEMRKVAEALLARLDRWDARDLAPGFGLDDDAPGDADLVVDVDLSDEPDDLAVQGAPAAPPGPVAAALAVGPDRP